MPEEQQVGLLLVLWVVGAGIALWPQFAKRTRGAGLILAYVLSLGLIHWLPALMYRLPAFSGDDLIPVERGFVQSVIAVWAFALGTRLATLLPQRVPVGKHPETREQQLSLTYLLVGACSYIALVSPLGRLPTASALAAVGQQLFVVGLCLLIWKGWHEGQLRMMLIGIGLALLIPLFTIVDQGFLSFGAAAATIILAFLAAFMPVPRVLVGGIVVGVLGLSLFVSYFRDRAEIREVVWSGSSIDTRVSVLNSTLGSLEIFSLSNPEHLSYVDERLNQNVLVGRAVQNLSVSQDFARGRTLVDSALALVPRAIWPSKPIYAGSPEIVSRYTGTRYRPGTSVGVGHVLEFYINFGSAGVLLGFLVLGIALALIDTRAMAALLSSNHQSFALWFLVGISFIHVGGSLVELSSSAAASVLFAVMLNKVVLQRLTPGYIQPGPAVQPSDA